MSGRRGRESKRWLKLTLWIIGVLALVFVGLFAWFGGQFISYEFDYSPEERLQGLISSEVTESEIELDGVLETTTSAHWYWLSKRFFPGIMLVNAKVNGRRVTLTVDTGSTLTALAPLAAVNAEITLSDKRGKSFMWGREVPIYQGYVRELKLGELIARNLPVAVWGLRPTIKLLGIPIYRHGGLLGMNLLEHLAIRLDLRRGKAIFSREPLPPPPGASSAVLQAFEEEELSGPLPVVEGFIGDAGPFRFIYDTGGSGPMLIGEEIWQKLGLGNEKRIILESVRLGEIELHEVPAVRWEGGPVFRRKFMLLGNNIFLANGYEHLTLDFLAGRLYAERQ